MQKLLKYSWYNVVQRCVPSASFNIGQKKNAHSLANAAQWCMCLMASVGRQQRDNVADKVLSMLANSRCLLGDCRPLIYPTVLSTNAPPQSTLNKKLFGKNNIYNYTV